MGRCGSLLSLIQDPAQTSAPLTPWGRPKAALKKTEEEQNAVWWRKLQALFWAGGEVEDKPGGRPQPWAQEGW